MWHTIKTEDDLPPVGKYVIARHNRDTWQDSSDQTNVNCVVVKLRRGISLKEREKLAEDNPRKKEFYSSDQHGNNLKPYYWDAFGPSSFFGHEITEWMFIPNNS